MTKQEFMAMSLPYNLKFISISKKFIQELSLDNFKYLIKKDRKPVLRPISDLNKEMQEGRTYLQYFECMFDFESDKTCPIRMYINSGWTTTINELPFEIVIKLVEWHFDICGLIESDEAVDYHTIPDFVF